MKKIDNIRKQYKEVSYIFLIDMLLFSNHLDVTLDQVKRIIMTQEFVDRFQKMITRISKDGTYPLEAYQNAVKILDYLEEHEESLKLDDCYQELEKMVFFSDHKYYEEFCTKVNQLKDYQMKLIIYGKKRR